jgi:hypothetical protein
MFTALISCVVPVMQMCVGLGWGCREDDAEDWDRYEAMHEDFLEQGDGREPLRYGLFCQ